jgi:hypothetical protein
MGSAWLWALPALGVGQLALAAANLRRFQSARADSGPAGPRRVAVLIPARNEACRIGPLVAAVLADPAVGRVRVLDDHSTDGTAEAARRGAGGDPRFELLEGQALPPGWTGKSFACHQLTEGLREDWWVFLDADVSLAPGAIAEAVRRAAASGAELSSFWPRQTLETPGERWLVPMLDVVLVGFWPFGLAEDGPDARFAAANGQCLVFSRRGYALAGGHQAVRADMVDDVALARAMKRAGGRIALTDAGGWASVRMYAGLGDAWSGFTKNLYPAFGGRPGPFVAGMGLFALLHAVPVVGLVIGLALRWPGLWGPMAAQLGLGLALRALLVARLGHPAPAAIAHPLSAWLVVALGLASWRAAGRGPRLWPGREYAREGRP